MTCRTLFDAVDSTSSEQQPRYTLHLGDCREVLRGLPENSVDAVVCDPPYELGFMGKSWDSTGVAFDPATWKEVLRVVKPGGHILAFAGSRTQHRIAVAIEDAGWEIRDTLMWVYSQGFPKSLDVSKAIDKMLGAAREVVGDGIYAARRLKPSAQTNIEGAEYRFGSGHNITAPATDAAKQYSGFGTALKPAYEPIILARKPLIGTVAANVLTHGTGGLNIDGCRIGDEILPAQVRGVSKMGTFEGADGNITPEREGRWPANFLHDNSPEVTDLLGNAARFFYHPKCSKKDRDEGLEDLEPRNNMRVNAPRENEDEKHSTKRSNFHPTVKPTTLMRYLCRLITPPGGVILDCFMGSGSTGKAALIEGFQFVGIEQDKDYMPIARARIEAASKQ
jgi:DNA modification methylase